MKKSIFFLAAAFYAVNAFSQWQPAGDRIKTIWAEKISPENVLSEYPRPQMQRDEWLNLNGLWNYRTSSGAAGKILVPFALESSLSGVQGELSPDDVLTYERHFSLPEKWKNKNVLLHFGAVDWKTEIFINDKKIGSHTGGYTPFEFDITSYLKNGENTLFVKVSDPSDKGFQMRGKQTLTPAGIFYTAVSGIWQTVWFEPVEKKHIISIKPVADIDNEKLFLNIENTDNVKDGDYLQITLKDGEKVVADIKSVFSGQDTELSVPISLPDAKLWSPETPFLYDVEIALFDKKLGKTVDKVKSYAAMRKIALARDSKGFMRIQLNNSDYFQVGVMSQGYFPDGLYTAPTDEAMIFDIEKAKSMGFNAIRKHLKVEPARFYAHCDRLGMLVWQDIPSANFYFSNGWRTGKLNDETKLHFRAELRDIIDYLRFFPSVAVYTIFNEGWGEFDIQELTDWTKKYDSSRLVIANGTTMGMRTETLGDIFDLHSYPYPMFVRADENRASVIGGWGGITNVVPEHVWQWNSTFGGYANAQNKEDLETVYEANIVLLRASIPKGLSAVIFTQLTDIETEMNGLITYDRKIVKVDKANFREINEKLKAGNKQPVVVEELHQLVTPRETNDDVIISVEQMPEFIGGLPALMQYLAQNIKYPIKAFENGIEGTTIIRFIVEKDGSIGDIIILRGFDFDCDAEAVRVVKNMPKWKAGMQDGKPVRVYFTVPVKFLLQQPEKK